TAADTAVSLLTPFAAFLGSEAVGTSGVLATVTTGLFVGRYLLSELRPAERLQALAFWDGMRFLLEGFAFVLIGLQLRFVLADVEGPSAFTLLHSCLLIGGTTIVVRVAWMIAFNCAPRVLNRIFATQYRVPPWQHAVVIAWAGMRGVDSL